MIKIRLIASVFLAASVYSYGAAVHLNQLGFYPEESKKAVAVGASSDSFYVVNSQNSKVFSGTLGAQKNWDASGENARIADFSPFSDIGEYKIQIAGCPDSYMFKISHSVHLELAKASIKAFYYNRASFALEEQFAGVWARNAGHPDNEALIHPSAASANRPAGSTISSPGGWYDAGDYGKYIVNSGISTYTLLSAYELFSDFFDTLGLNIPESSNDVPDLLDEVLWNLRWMLTMQDPSDGGVYHKLTTASFCGFIMPEEDTGDRYVVQKSTAATLDFAAVTAQAYRIFSNFNTQLPGLADSCLQASLKAWEWARKNPSVLYNQTTLNANYDPNVTTGEYGNGTVSDEFSWAATELYIATQRDSFFTIAYPEGLPTSDYYIPGWPDVATLGLYSLFTCRDKLTSAVNGADIISAITDLANTFKSRYSTNPYGISMNRTDFYWGSNAVAANMGMAMVFGFLATANDDFKTGAINQLDYLVGRNPTGYSYVTGNGDNTPMFIHHRPSSADGVDDPVPGFLAGGPNSSQQDVDDCDYYTSTMAALSYVDSTCSYASNEIAINWNAPLAFLAGAIEAITTPATGVKDFKSKRAANSSLPVINQRQGLLNIRFPESCNGKLKVVGISGKVLKSQNFSNVNEVSFPANWSPQIVFVSVQMDRKGSQREHFSQEVFSGIYR